MLGAPIPLDKCLACDRGLWTPSKVKIKMKCVYVSAERQEMFVGMLLESNVSHDARHRALAFVVGGGCVGGGCSMVSKITDFSVLFECVVNEHEQTL